MEDQSILAGFFALSFVAIVIMLIWAFIAYLLTVFALYTMAKNDGAEDGILAFIPFLNSKVWGDLAREKLPDFLKEGAGWKVFGIYVACFILNFIPIISLLASVVVLVLSIYLVYAILERYGTNAILFTVIHVITCSIFLPIHLFLIRNEPTKY
ncbi:hypothetical protein bmyco0002_41110 [Bacillus pseudomycoides]|uniref:hypothetical protein n=1 Tax=Bacillus pseudomycoides TaxID=64104 RepID=UPI0001A158D0|nr:hypothetical protein [Bacillus pseudomycoides]EEM03420.1 hypothetical protein bmyco0002_41110 [Bacillus pseudomycoides]PGC37023.1 hypothetical protein COM18_20350 [Bacillus pseudomycoides]